MKMVLSKTQRQTGELRGSVCPLLAALVGYTGGADVGRVKVSCSCEKEPLLFPVL